MIKPLLIMVFAREKSPTSTRYAGFAKRLQKANGFKGYEVMTVALENLAFIVNEKKEASVIDSVSGVDLADASFVYLKSWMSLPEEADALAYYLYHKGVQFADMLAMDKGTLKLSTHMKLWSSEVPTPFSLYARKPDVLLDFISKTEFSRELGEKFILKDVNGSKGSHNYLVDVDEAKEILNNNPEIAFIAQRYIENQGDFRVGVYMEKARFVIQRVGSDDTHLNNISTGGKAEYIPTLEAPKSLLNISERAARTVNLQIAGVDVIQDKISKKWFVLEVNQGSQIVTGAFVDENMAAFNQSIEESTRDRLVRKRKQPMKIIGRRAYAKLTKLGVTEVVAKIDTGAYNSTLHADNIRLEKDELGVEVLKFEINPIDGRLETSEGKTQVISTKDFLIRRVRSSNGYDQQRYSIKTKISIEGRVFSGTVTLSNRSDMNYPFLIGRKLIRSRFIVNTELDERNQPHWNY